MIIYQLNINQFDVNRNFKAIRTKNDLINTLMNCIKLSLLNINVPEEETVAKICIFKNNTTNRFVVFNEKSYFSLAIPFQTTISENKPKFRYSGDIIVDNQIVSIINGLMSSKLFERNCDIYEAFEAIDLIIADFDSIDIENWIWPIFQDLLSYNDGYLRYDYDEDNQNGHFHPLNHLDIFYTNPAQIKTGLKTRMSQSLFMDFLNRETECHYSLPITEAF